MIGAASVGIGIGGWQYRDRLKAFANENLGPPKTENEIKEVGGNGFLNRFVLYESGAALMEFGDDYGCYERIAVGDTTNLRGNNLNVWDLPKDGELVVDMRKAVSKTKDPSNEFWLGAIGGNDSYCFGFPTISKRFTVPQDWIE